MLGYCLADVADAESTVIQHYVNVLCLLGILTLVLVIFTGFFREFVILGLFVKSRISELSISMIVMLL